MQNELTTVATYASPFEAAIAKGCLECAGIRAFFARAISAGLTPFASAWTGGVDLQVPALQLRQAIEVLGDLQKLKMPAPQEAALSSVKIEEPDLKSRDSKADGAWRSIAMGLLYNPLEFSGTGLV